MIYELISYSAFQLRTAKAVRSNLQPNFVRLSCGHRSVFHNRHGP